MKNKIKRALIWSLVRTLESIALITLLVLHFGSRIIFKKELFEWTSVGHHVGSEKTKKKVFGGYYKNSHGISQ